MANRKSGIPKRRGKVPPVPMKELRIPLKKKTALNIMTMNGLVTQKLRELNEAQMNLQNHVVPLLTERNLPDNVLVKEVTEKEPYELIVMVPKR